VATTAEDEKEGRMKVAAALFDEEISPRFDCCTGLLVCGPDGSEVRLDLRGRTPGSRLEEVVRCKPDCLLCGGIRRCDLFMLTDCGIHVIDGLTGDARDAVSRCRDGTLESGGAGFFTPATQRRHGRCRRRKGGHNARS